MNILEKLNVRCMCYHADIEVNIKDYYYFDDNFPETVKFKVGEHFIKVEARSAEEAWQKIEEKCWEGLANAVGQQIKILGE